MSLTKYLGWFTLTYVGAGLVLAVIGTFVDIGSGISVIVPMIAAMSAGDRFVRDQGRLPTTPEKRILITASFAISVVIMAVTIMVVVIAVPDTPRMFADTLGWRLTTLLLGVGLALTYLLIWLGYGWFTRRALVNHKKRLQRQP